MKLIDKSALVAEIERIKKEECPIDTYEGRTKLFYFEQFLSFINTLEVEEVDLKKEATEFIQTKEFVESKENPILLIAKHFFKLGLKAQKGK